MAGRGCWSCLRVVHDGALPGALHRAFWQLVESHEDERQNRCGSLCLLCAQSVRAREEWVTGRGDNNSLTPHFPSMAAVQVQAALHGVYWNHKVDVRPALPASWLLRVGAAADADGVVRSVRANPGRARPRTTHTLSADQAPAAETTTPLTSAAKT